MKRHIKYLSLSLMMIAYIFILTSCDLSGTGDMQIDTKTAILQSMANVNSVETSITMEMQARIGAQGDSSAHSASIGSDVTIEMTANPLAVHAEYYSRVMVDGVTSRDDKEYYIVEEDHGQMGRYEYVVDTDEWEHTTLTHAEKMAVPAQNGLIYDWGAFLNYLAESDYTESVEGKTCYYFAGNVPACTLQEFFFDANVFGSFMYNTEMLLTDLIPCELYVDSTTYLPVQIVLSFADSFIVSDMAFETADVIVTYKNWNELDSVEVPKKVQIVATDPDVEFYNTYYAWNLFLPYVNGNTEQKDPGLDNTGVSFTSDWETYQIRIDGGMTKLPIAAGDLEKIGYSLDSAFNSTIIEPNQYMENVAMKKGSDTLICTFYNPDTTAQPISNCSVGAIDLSYGNNANGSIKLYMPGEISLGVSVDALLSAYGNPDMLETAFAADTYTWYGETENQGFVAEVSTVNKQVIRLYLKNIPVTGGQQ